MDAIKSALTCTMMCTLCACALTASCQLPCRSPASRPVCPLPAFIPFALPLPLPRTRTLALSQTNDEYADRRGGGGGTEFAYLSALLNVKPPPADNFKLNLFGEEDMGMGERRELRPFGGWEATVLTLRCEGVAIYSGL